MEHAFHVSCNAKIEKKKKKFTYKSNNNAAPLSICEIDPIPTSNDSEWNDFQRKAEAKLLSQQLLRLVFSSSFSSCTFSPRSRTNRLRHSTFATEIPPVKKFNKENQQNV